VQTRLDTLPRRVAAFLISAAALALLAYHGIRLYVADRRIESARFARMQRAVALEPGDPEYWDRLGRFKETDFEQPDFPQAARYFQRAVSVDPRNSRYWLDLASAYELCGDSASARKALDSARSAYPASADVLWTYGNALLVQGDYDGGLKLIHQAVSADPKLLPLAISRAWLSTRDPRLLLDRVLPRDLDAYFDALNFFASLQQSDAGLVVWKGILDLNKPFPLERSFDFFDELIHAGRASDARGVWRTALAKSGLPADGASDPLVSDGGFDRDFPNGGFGWRISPMLGVSADFDSVVYHSPPRSLRLDFGGATNLDLSEPRQYVPVQPSHLYKFRAFLRTEGVSTESGIRFYIFDPNHSGAVEVLTPGLTGTHDWTAIEADVSTGPQTALLQICFRRLPSRLFENRLSGTVWADDISLTPEDSSAAVEQEKK
jgi:tetratricopeptide (TPR) repeat protein